MNLILIWLSVTTIADAFLHKCNVCTHDQLSALWRNARKTRLPKKATYASAQSFPNPTL